MTQDIQKWLRFVTPGLIILIFAGLLGWITGLSPFYWPNKWSDAASSLTVLIPAGIYYLTPLRDKANRKFFTSVTENLRSNLVRISGLQDDPATYTWKAVRGVFWPLIDKDRSLTIKASQAYFNGYIWTTLADVRALALVFAAMSALLWTFAVDSALLAAVLFVLIAGLSYPASVVVTRKHREIGTEQLEIIEHLYAAELKSKLEAVRDRSNT
jgi:hypothetical protein